MAKKSKFNLKAFKKYVNTYDVLRHGGDDDRIIIKDMIYGIGIALDDEEYRNADGWKKFKAFIQPLLDEPI
jgi:hypothetical protein